MCPYLSKRCKQEHTLLEGVELYDPQDRVVTTGY